jgi:signal peptidase I
MMTDKEPKTQSTSVWSELVETIIVVAQALIIALVVRSFLFQPFNIPSGSMIPTLLVGDYLFVSKYSYGFSKHSFPFSPDLFEGRILGKEPERGDVVVFKLPRDNSTDYIKRVIGLPGDHIRMVNGHLHINGVPVKKELIGKKDVSAGAGYRDRATLYKETLPNGVSYVSQELEVFGNMLGRNTPDFEVPAGHYFMMGDNRDNSLDSRVSAKEGGVGFVPFENLEGKATILFFSIEEGTAGWQIWNWPWALRGSRLLNSVR